MSKIALVHDYFIQMGGAERVAAVMHDSFPTAPMPSLILNSLFGDTFTLYSVAPVGWLIVGWISAQQHRENSL